MQDLNKEASRFKNELWMGLRDLSTKTDLIILVHNLSHKIPWYNTQSTRQPSLSFLLDEAKALEIPWVLAVTNKFSVSAHLQKPAVEAVLKAYQATLSATEVVNSCPYVMPSPEESVDSDMKAGPHKLIAGPINLVRRSFQKKSNVLPVEGVGALCQLVHRVLRKREEAALEELAKERLIVELSKGRESGGDGSQEAMSKAKANSLTAAAVGASVGAGVGLVMAIVMGAASALRKP